MKSKKSKNAARSSSRGNSRLKIARKKKGLTQRAAAELLGVTPQAWSSAERGASKMHHNNLKKVAEKFDVSFSWLVTGEGSDTIAMPEDIGPGKFIRILSANELMTGRRNNTPPKYVFVPDLEEEALAYRTTSELPAEVTAVTLIVKKANLKQSFQNGKWYLLAIDGLLMVRRIKKVVLGKNKGMFKLTDFRGETDLLDIDKPAKGTSSPVKVKIWLILWRLEEMG